MGLESGTFLTDLVTTNPVGASDQKQFGDDHIRLIKAVLQNTFPGMAGEFARVSAKSGAYTVVVNDNTVLFNCTASLTLSLTAAATLGNKHSFSVFANGGDVTIDPNGAETINGAATLTVPNGHFAHVWCNAVGFFADVSASLGANTFTGLQTWSAGANIASAATLDLTAATGNIVRITGTTATSAVTLNNGQYVVCYAVGAWPLTYHATNHPVQGGVDYTCAAGDLVIYSKNASAEISVQIVSKNAPVSITDRHIQDFRLTLTSGLPVTLADVTSAGTIYACPYKGNSIALYTGTAWIVRTSAQFSLALSGLTSGRPYDVFCYDNAGVPTLEFLAWTNDTTRATALAYQDGILVKSGAATRRYLGTFYTTSTTTTEDSAANRYLWNYYNRVNRKMLRIESTASWTYTTATYRQANASSANQLNFVIGVSEDAVCALVEVSYSNTGAGVQIIAAMGLDSTSAPAAGNLKQIQYSQTAGNLLGSVSSLTEIISAGRHYISWLEYSAATGTTTWYGSSNSGIIGSMLG